MLMNPEDNWFEVGPDANVGMDRYYTLDISDDTVDSYKAVIDKFDTLIETLGKDERSPYYGNEMLFRKAMMNIRQYFEECMSRIDNSINVCEKILGNLDDICYYKVFDEEYLNAWDVRVKEV